MKIELMHPITHDDVNYGRGVHVFPDKLAQKLLAEAPHAAIRFVPGANEVEPGSVTWPGHLSKGEIQDKILARIGALKNCRRRRRGSGIPVDGIDSDISVLQWQLRCVECGNASDETLADHLSDLHRQEERSRTPSGGSPTRKIGARRIESARHALEKTALPPKRRDFSRYLDAAKLTPTQRDYVSLKFENEMSVVAIARLRNKHHSSVQEALVRAEAKLKSIPDKRLVSDTIRGEGEDEILERIDQERRHNETPSRRGRSGDMN